MTIDDVETVIVGAGQAGLALSYHLAQRGREHLLLERDRIGERWRSQRWDSLCFQFPNWMLRLPGFAYGGDDPDGFASRDEVVAFLEDYAAYIQAPVRTGVCVEQVHAGEGPNRFVAETDCGQVRAANVVVSTGPYQVPNVRSELVAAIGEVFQLHSGLYRSSEALPPGAVLVVGSGASGCQIAEDLVGAGRRVWLACGEHRPVPRRYRGRDFGFWQYVTGEFDRTVDSGPVDRATPLLTGVGGGRDLNLLDLARQGVTLLGRMTGGAGGVLDLATNLSSILARAQARFDEFVQRADDHVARQGLNLPPDAARRSGRLELPPDSPSRLDLRAAGVSTVIWATGYDHDFGWVQLPAFADAAHRSPKHRRGVSEVAGLYFLGLPWLWKRQSTLLAGVGEDAEHLARHICND